MLNIKTKLRRAFTIVELVVVIAVIAALAAILIPTFANVISSANESADTSLVKNLNTIFSSEQTVTSSKPSTMSEALELAADNGYNIENLTPSSSGDIVWDQTSNRFLLIDEDGKIVYMDGTTADDVTSAKYQLWYIASSEEEYNTAKEAGYSVYLNYEVASGSAMQTSTGLDVGKNEEVSIEVIENSSSASANAATAVSSVKKVTSGSANSSAQTLIFNTNGGTLTINNSNAEVKHYGISTNVTVTSASAYTTAASVKEIKVEVSLNITVESGASIITLNAGSNTVTVTIDTSAEVAGVVGGDNVKLSGNTSNTKKYSTADYSSYIAYVGGNFYKKLTEAVTAASNGATVTLLKNYSSSTTTGKLATLCTDLTKEVTIDLNGYTMSGLTTGTNLSGGTTSLTLKNGILKSTTTNNDTSTALISITNGSSISLINMEVTAKLTVLYPRGDASTVNVINSTITTEGTYAIGTNAGAVDNYNVKINVDNSILVAKTPVLVNVPGTYNFTNSTISTEKMYPCFIARGGNVTIDNCIICLNNSLKEYTTSSAIWNSRMDDGKTSTGEANTSWGSGSAVPYSALCVGNDADSGSYQYPTTCTVTNTEFHTSTGFMCVYVEGNDSQANGVTFNYSGCSFYYHTSGTSILDNLDGGIAYATTTPTEYISSLYDSTKTNPLNYAVIYTSDTASYVTINGTVYRDGTN